ncbi:Os05g0553300 [Oryza sativa Japonica Group]|uniref:Os05g0553300 protein n=1 Tax=Oryza sativa subsp. japonica TaxID=39947 RepID=Q6I635_ORYSJ|nr:unknown protein [Oryza sativa Japonica Group]BAF18176.1 Os05g0553300 [Oryza sativa Japonica Group]|eukprot:NP_001056262.1 Os05g0553300 [Oryza sativa Japonica Group]
MPPETRLQQRAWLPCAGHNVLSARRKSCRGWAVAHLLRRQPRRPRPLPGIAEAGGRLAAGNIKARSFFIVCLSAWPGKSMLFEHFLLESVGPFLFFLGQSTIVFVRYKC